MDIYSDSDWASDRTDRKSYSRLVIVLAGAIAWQSRKQQSVSLSALEAEHIAITEAVKEVIYG